MNEIISRLKETHRQIFASIIGDELYIWRPLTRREYQRVVDAAQDEHNLQERICKAAVLHPDGIDFGVHLAGIPIVLSPLITQESGYGTPEKVYETLETYRNEMSAFEHQAEAIITATFPQVSFDEMMDWTVDQLVWHQTRAEWVQGNIYGRDVVFREPDPDQETEPLTPAEEAEQMRDQGIDPMTTLDPKLLRAPFITLPLIGGTHWQNEEIWNGVREQVQARSRRSDA
jgi:hypothetical protein